jgi:Zn finger protein HypA/HybF involved in hydrogenase expression
MNCDKCDYEGDSTEFSIDGGSFRCPKCGSFDVFIIGIATSLFNSQQNKGE